MREGERVWKRGRFSSGQILLVGKHILVQSQDGPVYLVAADPKGFQQLGKIAPFESKTWNNLCIYGDKLIVRNDREAVCYRLELLK